MELLAPHMELLCAADRREGDRRCSWRQLFFEKEKKGKRREVVEGNRSAFRCRCLPQKKLKWQSLFFLDKSRMSFFICQFLKLHPRKSRMRVNLPLTPILSFSLPPNRQNFADVIMQKKRRKGGMGGSLISPPLS